MRKIQFFATSLLCILLFALAGLELFLKHSGCKKAVEKKLAALCQERIGCQWYGTVKNLNAVVPRITTENIFFTDDSKEWSWGAQKMETRFSWTTVLKKKVFELEITLHGAHGYSLYKEGAVPLMNHIKKFFSANFGGPFSIKSLTLVQGTLNIASSASKSINSTSMSYKTILSGEWFQESAYPHGTLHLSQGALSTPDQTITENLHASLSLTLDKKNPQNSTIHAKGGAQLVTPPRAYTIFFELDHHASQGTAKLIQHQNDGSYFNQKMIWNQINEDDPAYLVKGEGILPLIGYPPIIPAGHCSFNGSYFYKPSCAQGNGTIVLSNILLGGIKLPSQKYDFSNTTSIFEGTIALGDNNEAGTGYIIYDKITDLLKGKLSLTIPITLPCTFLAHRKEIALTPPFTLELTKKNNHACIDISALSASLHLHANTENPGYLEYAHLYDHTHTPKGFLEMIPCPDTALNKLSWQSRGTLDLTIIRPLCTFLSLPDPGPCGTVSWQTTQEKDGYALSISLPNAPIRFFSTYNYIKEIDAQIYVDTLYKRIVCDHLNIKMHKGSIHSQQATVYFDESFTPSFIHVPLELQSLFLNKSKEFFGVFSGSFLYTSTQNNLPHLSGTISLKQSQFKKKLQLPTFSGSSDPFIKALPIPKDCTLTISGLTSKPLIVKTPFIETEIRASASIKGSFKNPSCHAQAELNGGLVHFPYKSLVITKGHLTVMPHSLDDPHIELTAKGMVKNYHVTVHAQGSLQDPTIHFESTPSLPEEQIVALLIAGSPQGSLMPAMPGLILKNIKDMFIDQELHTSGFTHWVKKILTSLKHIRLTPNFMDQTARGGFRAAIEIDINDQINAVLQKNFSLSEDTRCEIEYHLSDDVTIRGTKDERGDVGGEVEMRWKF